MMKLALALAASAAVALGASGPRAKVLVLKEFDLSASSGHLTEKQQLTLRYFAINSGAVPAFDVSLLEDFDVEQWKVSSPSDGASIEEDSGLLRLSKTWAEILPGGNESFSVSLTPLLAGKLASVGAVVNYKYENATASEAASEDLDSGKTEEDEHKWISVSSRSSGPGYSEILTTAAWAKQVAFESAETYHALQSWICFAAISLAFMKWRGAAGGHSKRA